MKRCIVCGSIGDDDSTVCKVCGNPFIDLADQSDKADAMDEMERRLEQVWTKVQEGEKPAEGDDMPAAQEGPAGRGDMSAAQEKPAGRGDMSAAQEKPAGRDDMSAAQEKPVVRDDMPASGEEPVDEPDVTVLPDLPDPVSLKKSPAGNVSSPERTASGSAQASQAAREPARQQTQGVPRTRTENVRPAGENMEAVRQHSQGQEQPLTESTGQMAGMRQTARPRRRSGPQIYGQDSMAEYKGTQGVIRRDVQGGAAAARRDATYDDRAHMQQTRTADRQPAAKEMANGSGAGGRQPLEGYTDRRMDSEIPAQDRPAYNREVQPTDRRMGQAVNVPPQRVNARQRGDMQPYAQVPQEDRQQEKGALAARKIMETARVQLSSPLLLFIALFHTIYFAGAIIAIFAGELDYAKYGRLLGSFPLPAQLASYVSVFQSAMELLDNAPYWVDLVLHIPNLLFFLGIWLLCITVRTSKEQMSGAGFVFVRISVILNMIAACILLLVVLVLSVALVIASWSGEGNGRFPIAVAVLIVAIVATMAIVMYYFCSLATISAVSKNARLGETYGKASYYVAAMHVVFAFTAIINILSGVLNGWIPVIISGVGKFLWMILLGMWIFSYRDTLSEFEE